MEQLLFIFFIWIEIWETFKNESAVCFFFARVGLSSTLRTGLHLNRHGITPHLCFVKNMESSVVQHNLPERWLYWIGFSIAQQILPGKKHRVSAQRYMDPFSCQVEEEKIKQRKTNQQKNPNPATKSPRATTVLLTCISFQKDCEVH